MKNKVFNEDELVRLAEFLKTIRVELWIDSTRYDGWKDESKARGWECEERFRLARCATVGFECPDDSDAVVGSVRLDDTGYSDVYKVPEGARVMRMSLEQVAKIMRKK